MNISVFGCGYVGLVTAACFCELGNKVICYDNDKSKIISLNKAKVPFYEPGLDELILKNAQKNKIEFTSNIQKCFADSEIYFVCVGTPQKKTGEPDLTFIKKCIQSILSSPSDNAQGKKHIFIKSTVPPGTTKYFQKLIDKKKLSNKFSVSSNPEFLKEGTAINDFMRPDRVVIGSLDSEAIEFSKKLYRTILWKSDRLLVVKPESSEIIKYASNAFLAMKISFMNEIAKLSDVVGADINEIRRGTGLDSRISPDFLYSGIGFGGSCFPKDLRGLSHTFKQNHLKGHMVDATIKVNELQIMHFLKKIQSVYNKKELKTKTFAVWGQAFKPNTDDIRESVGIKLVQYLSPLVKEIKIFEPIALKNTKFKHKDIPNIKYAKSAGSALKQSHALIICTEYREFWSYEISKLQVLKDKNIFDGRNILDKESLEDLSFNYFGIGR
ncbi:UDP-glucose/GDP-mannose dehydrogenase family protein [Gammaproteobacteria bacterium]|nr:UDP-glucose/GDP-mannose dehydrogenase family protein [Gammaproteobacteria bacterium]MDA8798627.1 UDP-glucose/GDP-mannose dehydrogenase family protein [Gammaproteobacteria bacterium]MDC0919307.1 UDP-glucose/GDP-mannose dehydrogenase family protein [Gammaproteobacteria bacterium]